MDLVRWLIFEDPRALWVMLGLAEVVLLVAWTRGPSRAKLRALITVPLAALLFGVLDWAVETDYEKVRHSVRSMSRAAEAGNVEGFVEWISADYASGPFKREDLAALVRAGLPLVRVRTERPHVQLEDGRATVTQGYQMEPQPGARPQVPPNHRFVTWRGEFAPGKDGRWRLTKAEMVRPYRIQPEKFLPLLRRSTAGPDLPLQP